MSCLKKCLKAEAGSAAADHIDAGLEWIFHQAADFIREQAKKEGVEIPDTLDDKLYRYGVKNGMLPVRGVDIDHYEAKAQIPMIMRDVVSQLPSEIFSSPVNIHT